LRHPTDPSAQVHRHPTPFVAAPLAFADVHAHSDVDAKACKGRHEFEAAAGRLGGPVEQREDAVAGVLGALPAVLRQQSVDQTVVGIELVAPMRVALSAEQFR
jgi:hypothetical protein